MCGSRNEADVTMGAAIGEVIVTDGEKPCIFPLRTGIRLHGEGIITGDRAQLFGEIVDHFLVTERLIGRHEGMDVGKFRPGDRQHFRCRVQFHGAGTERDHRAVERQIAVRKAADVTGHLAFGTVHVEDRMRHVLAGAQQFLRQAIFRLEIRDREIAAESTPDGFQRCRARALVKAHADLGRADLAQVHAFRHGRTQDDALHMADFDGDGVEEGFRLDGVAELFQTLGHQHGLLVGLLGNRLDTLRAMEDAIH